MFKWQWFNARPLCLTARWCKLCALRDSWAAQPGCVGGQCPSHFWDQRGTGGTGGAVQWKWSLLLQQTVFIQYCTSDWISTPLTLVDTCQVNDIWKDSLGRVSRVHPTGLLHQWRSQGGGALVHVPPPSWERLNGLALMTIFTKTFTLSTMMSLISM